MRAIPRFINSRSRILVLRPARVLLACQPWQILSRAGKGDKAGFGIAKLGAFETPTWTCGVVNPARR